MIRFGLHLTLRGGREALVRLLVTTAAVAVGVGLLLATLAAVHAVNAQNARYAWLNSAVPEASAPGAVPSPYPLWGALTTDRYAGFRITRVDVAATSTRPTSRPWNSSAVSSHHIGSAELGPEAGTAPVSSQA